MPNILTKLKLDHVASVDRGAGEGVHVVLFKRDQMTADQTLENMVGKVIGAIGFDEAIVTAKSLKAFLGTDDTAIVAQAIKRVGEVREYAKREFSDDERKDLADKGHALPDGSFPIVNTGDLKNAIQAIGRAKDPAKAKTHIRGRARALGASDQIPDSWGKTSKGWIDRVLKAMKMKGMDAVDFDQAHEATEAGEFAQGMMEEIQEAVCDLQTSVCSIMCDDTVTDKQAALDATFDQFKACIQGTVPEWMEKSLTAAGVAAALAKGANMTTLTPEQITKLQADMATMQTSLTALQATNKALTTELAIAKMSDEHRAYMSSAGMDGDEKDKFHGMTAAERDEHVKANPIEKRLNLPAHIVKQLTDGSAALAILKAKDEKKDEEDAEDMEKRLNLPAGTAKVLAKSLRDPAVVALTKHVETLQTQIAAGDLFKNFGSRSAQAGSAFDTLKAKADALRLTEVGKKLTPEQAFAKVYEDRANAETVALYKREQAGAH